MKRRIGILFAAAIVLAAGCNVKKGKEQSGGSEVSPKIEQQASPQVQTGSVELNDKLKEKIIYFLKTAFNVPANVAVSLSGSTPALIKGFTTVTAAFSSQGMTQNVDIYVSNDSRYVLVGRLMDLEGSPWEKKDMSKLSLADSPSKGNKKAPVTIVEFSDFQCPFCANAFNIVENEVLKKYGKKVRFVYKHFPLSSIHPWADNASIAAECALNQKDKAFWKFYENFYKEQKNITNDNLKEKVESWAKSAGLDTKKFQECYDKKETLPRVERDRNDGAAIGVTGTPAFLINGIFLGGALPFEKFQEIIDHELKQGS
ncbi:MAG TPA: thioredoxin domain-containing protein [bacterium]